jgi:RecD/TraA family predicted helicase
MEQQLHSYKGTVDRVLFPKPGQPQNGFTIGVLNGIKFKGNLTVNEGDRIKINGIIESHPQYGDTVIVQEWSFDMDVDTGGLAAFIANNSAIKGIGEAKANKLIEKFKSYNELIDRLKENPEGAAQYISVPVSTINLLVETLEKSEVETQVKCWLSQFQLTNNQIQKLYDRYGADIKAKLESNPYMIIGEIDGYGFTRVDQIAFKMGVPKIHEGRIRAGLLYCLKQESNDGNCWTSYEMLVELARKILIIDRQDEKELIENQLKDLSVEMNSGVIFNIDGGIAAVALQDIYEKEMDLMKWWRESDNESNPVLSFDLESKDGIDITNEFNLNPKQSEAWMTFIKSRICVITGGAGTGKTHTINAILKTCKLQDSSIHVSLCAPTGKAVRRMQETTGYDAQTIHRLLEYNPGYGGFTRTKENPIECDVLIIDEFSMVDVNLAHSLFSAVNLSRTAVVIVGDYNQLPAIGPGNLLKDIIKTNLLPVVILDEVVRQAGILKFNSIEILKGNVPYSPELRLNGSEIKAIHDALITLSMKCDYASSVDGQGFNKMDAGTGKGLAHNDVLTHAQAVHGLKIVHKYHKQLPESITKVLEAIQPVTRGEWERINLQNDQDVIDWIIRFLDEIAMDKFGYRIYEDVQIITPMKKGTLGTRNLNIILQRFIHKKLFSEEIDPVEEGKNPKIYRNDKIIQTVNNYNINVMNGTIGFVKDIIEKPVKKKEEDEIDLQAGDMDIQFEDKRILVPRSEQGSLQLGYALTIHKCQGSEFSCVIVLCHNQHKVMLNRNLLYTGVTRARKSCFLVGSHWAMNEAAKTVYSDKRRTFIDLLCEGETNE